MISPLAGEPTVQLARVDAPPAIRLVAQPRRHAAKLCELAEGLHAFGIGAARARATLEISNRACCGSGIPPDEIGEMVDAIWGAGQ